MLKANELRLGNLVNYEQTTHYITLIDRLGFIETRWIKQPINELNYTSSIDIIKPIELTEEWLIKFGFYKKNGYGFINITMKGGLYNSLNNDCYIYNYYGLQLNCKYVHQLQNLYFALTGSELTVA